MVANVMLRNVMLAQMWCRHTCGRRGTMWKFESKELCESPCSHSKCERTGGEKRK